MGIASQDPPDDSLAQPRYMSSIITYILLHLTVGGPWGQGVGLARLMTPDGLRKLIKIIILIRANPLSKMHHVSSAAFRNERNEKNEKGERYETGGEKSERNETGGDYYERNEPWGAVTARNASSTSGSGRSRSRRMSLRRAWTAWSNDLRPTELGPNGP